jgi:hypothetical protein
MVKGTPNNTQSQEYLVVEEETIATLNEVVNLRMKIGWIAQGHAQSYSTTLRIYFYQTLIRGISYPHQNTGPK